MNQVTRVSVVSRYPMVKEHLTQVLLTNGCAVVGAYSDELEFLSRLASDRPAVTVADLDSFEGPGEENEVPVLTRMNRFQCEAKVLVLSAHGKPSSTACYQEGAAGYLDKTEATPQSLLTVLKAIEQGQRVFPVATTESPFTAPKAPPASPLLNSLSWRERQVLTYVAAGADNLKIATLLQISERTVKAHMCRLYQKLGSENRTQLALLARQCGVKPAEDV